MNLTRRDALRQCLIITVGAAIIPACQQAKSKPVTVLKNLNLNGDQEKLLTEVCETIIPATNTPGAKDTLAHLFVLRMVDDMFSKEEQEQFVEGMKEFDKIAKNKFNKSFVQAGAHQKEELLSEILNNKGKEITENVTAFVKTMKKLTVQGFVTSRYFLTKVRVYKLIPGKFSGCFPVTPENQKELQLNKKEVPI